MKKVRKILKNLSGLFLCVGIYILIEALFPDVNLALIITKALDYITFIIACIAIVYFSSVVVILLFLLFLRNFVLVWYMRLWLFCYDLVDKWKERREKNPKNLTIKNVTDLKIAKPI